MTASRIENVTASPSEVLESRHWLRCSRPFPHLVARNVFTPSFYGALEREMRDLLAMGLSETPAPGRFSRSLPGYDSYGIGLGRQRGVPSELFVSRGWRDLMAGLWGVTATSYMSLGAHHHSPNGNHGFIHNDFNPVWFPRAPADAIQVPNPDLCAYKTGEGTLAPEEKIQVVRGVVLLFYLANDPWRPGDGGETGLYESAEGPVTEPAVACPPENNSLVCFECTPDSWHTFISNTRVPRTSLIMWVHRPVEEAAALYREDALERWKS